MFSCDMKQILARLPCNDTATSSDFPGTHVLPFVKSDGQNSQLTMGLMERLQNTRKP